MLNVDFTIELPLSSSHDAMMTVVDSVKTDTLHSDAHNSDSRRSSQAFPVSSLEAPRPSKVHNLRLWTSVRSSFYQRTLLPARNKVGVFHNLASSNRQTDGACQSRVRSVPPALCEWMARWLVWSLTLSRVPAQQSCPLHYPTASIPARHRKTFSHGIQTLTGLFWSRDSQWIHGKNEDGDQRSEVRDLQGTGRHEKVLRPTKNSGSGVQSQWQGLPWRIGYPNYVPLAETLALMTWPLCSGTVDWTHGLLLKTATSDEVTPSGVQCSEAHCHIPEIW